MLKKDIDGVLWLTLFVFILIGLGSSIIVLHGGGGGDGKWRQGQHRQRYNKDEIISNVVSNISPNQIGLVVKIEERALNEWRKAEKRWEIESLDQGN